MYLTEPKHVIATCDSYASAFKGTCPPQSILMTKAIAPNTLCKWVFNVLVWRPMCPTNYSYNIALYTLCKWVFDVLMGSTTCPINYSYNIAPNTLYKWVFTV